MSRRRQSREAAFQALYAMSYNQLDRHETVTRMGGLEERDIRRHDALSSRLLELVEQHAGAIDDRLESVLKTWTNERLAIPDRALLRLGVAELLYCDDIPPRVTINEYIELAKSFGDSDSPRFVNGILDRIAKDLAESSGSERGDSKS